MKLGFIGLGHMGSAMAANLIKAGHEVTVFNRTSGRAALLIALGAHEAGSVAEAANAEAVITMLSDDEAASEVAFGDAGLIAHLPKGAIHISMSSISVACSQRLSQAHARSGQRYLAAPVFGRPAMAQAGKLFIVVAGDPATIESCQPLLRLMGQKVIAIGAEPSHANLVKLSGNFLSAAAIDAMGEAVALVEKAGIDRRAYIELLTSTVFSGPPYTIYGPLIAQRIFEPAAFAAPLAYKDIRLALEAAEHLQVPMPMASLLHDRFLRLLRAGGEHLDWAALGDLASRDAGEAAEHAGTAKEPSSRSAAPPTPPTNPPSRH
jgi:3-hydroxyisobutyrate dehydrogenase-like beta-hydroxyacid dehydrogenase